ncbi:carbohydrate-binding module family 50 protein [Apiospora marii]|uniref:Carbohydrate-binding module family 50 protein n=1 Tax=Apiospora marii TaxID=335849 RepID=A0ABR1RBS5_9PEZI
MAFAWSCLRAAQTLAVLGLLALDVHADRLLPVSYLPEGISSPCATALSADIACPRHIATLQSGLYYPQTSLRDLCTTDCAAALSSYHSQVVANCASDTWLGPGDEEQPVAMISETIRYHYNFTCLTDNGRFCNNVAAAFAAAANSKPGGDSYDLPAGGDFGEHDTSNRCDACLLKNLAFQAGSPYYDGPKLRSMSLYESRTSSCGIATAPLTTTPNTLLPSVTGATPPAPTCAGTTYTIKAGDDCHSISLAQGVGTAWLLNDNHLLTECADFPMEGELCLVNKCTVHTLKESDTCSSLTKQYGMSEAQLRAWNPVIDAGCYNLKQMEGDQLCVDKPGDAPYVTPGPTVIAPSIPTTAAPVPTNIAGQTNRYCGRFYEAKLGDYCNLITMRFHISLADFIFLNPAVNENCTNLYADESYCVQPVGQTGGYIPCAHHDGRPRGGCRDDAGRQHLDGPGAHQHAAPLANDTRDGCAYYLLGDDWQQDISGTNFPSNCHFAAQVLGVNLVDLQVWNPSLGDSTGSDCRLESGRRYCGRYQDAIGEPKAPPPPPGLGSFDPREGMVKNCNYTVAVMAPDAPSCARILEDYHLTIAQFYEMNPSVGADCSGLWAGYSYCVRAPGIEPSRPGTSEVPSSTTSAPTTSSAPTPPAQTQDGQTADCNKWHVVKDGDDCGVLEKQYSLTHAQLLAWNPAISEDCVNGFWGGYAYCVGVSSSGSSSTVTSKPPAETNGPVAAPEPNQAGNAVASCNQYGQAQDGDWCTAFADRHKVPYDKFYAWNTVLGANGQNCGGSFWGKYWYCIGVV